MDDVLLGAELKKLRKEKKMTLQVLSDKSTLSVSYLSQIERGLKTLTFTSLKKICESLEVDVNFFFNSKDSEARKMKLFNPTGKDFTYISLKGRMENPAFTPAVVDLPAGEARQSPYGHSGEEFVYILSGELEVVLDGETHTLYQDESFHIDSNEDHLWYNASDKVTRILLVTSKP